MLYEVITDVITINDDEARQLTGEYSLVVAARKIHEMGPKYVVIKKGEHGALLFRITSYNVCYTKLLRVKLASETTSFSSTPNLSTISAFTLDAMSDIIF